MTATSSAEFLTVDQLAERWLGQVTKATLATWRSRGNGPAFVKVGGRVLYRLADVLSYEVKNTRK
jgi:phosphatidylserine decarboxylase